MFRCFRVSAMDGMDGAAPAAVVGCRLATGRRWGPTRNGDCVPAFPGGPAAGRCGDRAIRRRGRRRGPSGAGRNSVYVPEFTPLEFTRISVTDRRLVRLARSCHGDDLCQRALRGARGARMRQARGQKVERAAPFSGRHDLPFEGVAGRIEEFVRFVLGHMVNNYKENKITQILSQQPLGIVKSAEIQQILGKQTSSWLNKIDQSRGAL